MGAQKTSRDHTASPVSHKGKLRPRSGKPFVGGCTQELVAQCGRPRENLEEQDSDSFVRVFPFRRKFLYFKIFWERVTRARGSEVQGIKGCGARTQTCPGSRPHGLLKDVLGYFQGHDACASGECAHPPLLPPALLWLTQGQRPIPHLAASRAASTLEVTPHSARQTGLAALIATWDSVCGRHYLPSGSPIAELISSYGHHTRAAGNMLAHVSLSSPARLRQG